jgi:site-specific recombinase XerD/ribosomal protein L40E
MSHDIYENPKRLEYVLKKIREDDRIIDKNKKILLDFNENCVAEGLSLARITRCLYALRTFAGWTRKSFKECKKNDIVKMVAELEKSEYAHATKQEMKTTLKKFFKWLRGKEEYPDEVRWLKCNRSLSNRKLPEDLLSEDDVKLLINSTTKVMERAMITILFESGTRIGELLSIKLKSISFDKYGCKLMIDGKTGMRQVRIVSSVGYLQEWLNKHPMCDNPESFLFIQERTRKGLNHRDVQRILRRIKKKSGIKKRINAHQFRHSRATILANFLTDAQMKEYLGWTQSSDMNSIYVHLSSKNFDNALLKMNGIEVEEKKEESKLSPKNCIRCHETNPPTNKFCRRCGMALDEKTAIEILQQDFERQKADQVMDKLIQNPEFKEMFLSKIKEIVQK